tara:strand:- start:32 stop:187 length:156 start_codon:yes stop_codon:yes gene_type:complete
MIHLQIIWEHIQAHAVGIGVGILGFLATISMFMPKNSKLYKVINFLSKRKK